MKIDWRPIDSIRPYEKNAKKHPEKQIRQIADSIENFGFNQPVVVDQDGVIVVGHGRYAAAQLLGMLEVPVTEVLGLTDEQVNAYRLADNKLNESDWDMSLVLPELKGLSLPNLQLTGFNPGLLDEKYQDYTQGSLQQRFVVPPFTVLDSRQGYWQERKRWWRELIGDNGESRENLLGGSLVTLSAKQNTSYSSGPGVSGVSLLDPVLSEVLLKWFCPPGGTTFDPFAGDTVFGFVSAYNGNRFTGIELREEQARLNNERTKDMLATYICDDGQNVGVHLDAESQDMMFSCPPYFDLEKYSELENDASNQDYDGFLAILRNAFTAAAGCLKPDRFACVVIGDVRDDKGMYYRIPNDIVDIFEEAGMRLYNEAILVEPLSSLPLRVQQAMKNRKLGKCHQNILVFYKGDPDNIKKNFPKLEYDSESVEP